MVHSQAAKPRSTTDRGRMSIARRTRDHSPGGGQSRGLRPHRGTETTVRASWPEMQATRYISFYLVQAARAPM